MRVIPTNECDLGCGRKQEYYEGKVKVVRELFRFCMFRLYVHWTCTSECRCDRHFRQNRYDKHLTPHT